MRLKCLRTPARWLGDPLNEEMNTVEEVHIASVYWYAGNLNSWWVKLTPGVTGYESASVKHILEYEGGWPACAGTPGSWDKLYVPTTEMNRLRDVLRLLPFPSPENHSHPHDHQPQ